MKLHVLVNLIFDDSIGLDEADYEGLASFFLENIEGLEEVMFFTAGDRFTLADLDIEPSPLSLVKNGNEENN